ncbi:MAG: hypothetical protein ACR2IK_01730 [Chloroflexota bacterium]
MTAEVRIDEGYPLTINDPASAHSRVVGLDGVRRGGRGLEAHGSRFVSEAFSGQPYSYMPVAAPIMALAPAAVPMPSYGKWRPGPGNDAPFEVTVIGGQVAGMRKRSVIKNN